MSTEANAIIPFNPQPAELMRQATDVAGVCREIVMRTAMKIQGRKFVKVEGWQAIATAHGCMLSIEKVSEDEEHNIIAIASVRRIADGAELGRAEGYVGSDEKTWNGRQRYARRAMAQTRAMSRAARSAFAHVVVLIDENLSTTPAEEMGGDELGEEPTPKKVQNVEIKRADEPAHELADDATFEKAVRAAAMERGITPAEADAGLAGTIAKLKNPADAKTVDWRVMLIGGIKAGKADRWKAPAASAPTAPSEHLDQPGAIPPADDSQAPEVTAAGLALLNPTNFIQCLAVAAEDAGQAMTCPAIESAVRKYATVTLKKTAGSLTGAERLAIHEAVVNGAFDFAAGTIAQQQAA